MSNRFTVFDCPIIKFPKGHNGVGNVTRLQNEIEVPFEIKRVYYLYDVPGGESRGAHAHKTLNQILIAASGSFDVTLDDGYSKKTVNLSRPFMGLYIKPGIWRDILNFSSGVICLVLASELYSADDYIRDYNDFLDFKKATTIK
jgi:oxalate decarboxylase/phosphoglucose isomerase-like protein (cupin superfamily)